MLEVRYIVTDCDLLRFFSFLFIFVYKISLKCHLWNKFSISDECARKARRNKFELKVGVVDLQWIKRTFCNYIYVFFFINGWWKQTWCSSCIQNNIKRVSLANFGNLCKFYECLAFYFCFPNLLGLKKRIWWILLEVYFRAWLTCWHGSCRYGGYMQVQYY